MREGNIPVALRYMIIAKKRTKINPNDNDATM